MAEALTLADYANDPRPLIAGVAKVLREESLWMDVLPFPTVAALAVKVTREGTLPQSIAWRDMGAAHGSSRGTKPTEIEEQVYSIGNEVIVDKMLVEDKTARLYDPATYNYQQTVKAIARNFAEKSITGLPGEKNPTGLFYRVMNDLGSDQRIPADPAGGSAGLDISPDTAALAANTRILFDKLDGLLQAVGFSATVPANGVYLVTNDTVIQRYNSIARNSGLLSSSQDALGRTFLDYRGAKFLDIGYKVDDETRILGNVETLTGAALTGGTGSSIYAVRLGDEYFTAWQEYGMTSSPFELQADKVTYKSVIDWAVGLALSHKRSVARLYGLIAA